MEKIRLIIADDQPITRSGLRNILRNYPDIELVAEAVDGSEAIRLANLHQPDVIIMDLKMPNMNGVDATRQIYRLNPHIGILVVTIFHDDTSIFPAIRAGAKGYILKDADEEELLRAIYTVAGGGVVFSASIASRVLQYLSQIPANLPNIAFDELTKREREILELFAQGLTNGEIAQRLSLTSKTVSNNISNVLVKLQVVDRAKLILVALEAGLGKKDNQ